MNRRILISYLTLALFIILVLEIPLAFFFATRERDRFTNAVASDAAVLATTYEDVLDSGAPLRPTAAEEYRARTGARVVLVDTNGIALLDTDAPVDRDFSTRPEIATALTGVRSQGTRHSDTLGIDFLYVAVPVASGGVVHGALRLTLPITQVESRIHQFWFGLAAVAGVILVAVAAVGSTLARSVSRPLRELEDAAHSFASGNLGAKPAPRDAPPEVVELAETLNGMARRLDEMLRAQRAFVADASHQLRTPLTALRLRLENLAEADVRPGQEAEINAAIEETERLGALVGQLLRLARTDLQPDREAVPVEEVVEDRVEIWSAVAAETSVTLRSVQHEPIAPVLLIPGAIDQILDNLIDNAIAATPAGGNIAVSLDRREENLILSVADSGPGLSDEEKRRALDRFWRGDNSSAGSGLGLSIVKAIADAHDGTVTLQDAQEGGLVVEVALPAPPATGPASDGSHQARQIHQIHKSRENRPV